MRHAWKTPKVAQIKNEKKLCFSYSWVNFCQGGLRSKVQKKIPSLFFPSSTSLLAFSLSLWVHTGSKPNKKGKKNVILDDTGNYTFNGAFLSKIWKSSLNFKISYSAATFRNLCLYDPLCDLVKSWPLARKLDFKNVDSLCRCDQIERERGCLTSKLTFFWVRLCSSSVCKYALAFHGLSFFCDLDLKSRGFPQKRRKKNYA